MGSDSQTVVLGAHQTSFYVVSPGYTNVDIRFNVDVIHGEVDVVVASTDQIFIVSVNHSTGHHSLSFRETGVFQTRHAQSILDHLRDSIQIRHRRQVVNIKKLNIAPSKLNSYEAYPGDVFRLNGLGRRLTVNIPHDKHDLSKQWFYVAISTAGKPNNAKAILYYNQDLPKIDLVLFFLVLVVILLMIMSGFVVGWKLRLDSRRERLALAHVQELETLASRPLAKYKLHVEMNKNVDIIRKRKSRTVSKKRHKENDTVTHSDISPLTVQITDDEMAAEVTFFVQYPGNKDSTYNLAIGAGLFSASPQQLTLVRETNMEGRRVNTRFFTTRT